MEPPGGLPWMVGEAFQSRVFKAHINTTKNSKTFLEPGSVSAWEDGLEWAVDLSCQDEGQE